MTTPTASAWSPVTDATVLYLIRHGATAANLAAPPRIQGRRSDPPLVAEGIRQAEEAAALLAGRPVVACYSSPLLRAVQTAELVARPHRLPVVPLDPLTECDAGAWDGLDWGAVRAIDPDGYARFHADPAAFGYPGGESYADVHTRAAPALAELLERHAGRAVVVVAHHVVNRTYLAGLLGLPPGQARRVVLGNGAVSVVVRQGDRTTVRTLAAMARSEERESGTE
ncbi:MAG: histidine phosphatase family protein [Gemmataceae bacterium]